MKMDEIFVNIGNAINQSIICECIDETNVERQILDYNSFYIIAFIENPISYGRPSLGFCINTSLSCDGMMKRYNLHTDVESNESTEIKF
ncbi:unnamed protein product [Didymodactylos carnosus]|uniref:Uncharacterized protein n=1 Tax=Didymodactylos carnosus TaxID=1234261 RepID=A0A814XMY5_9BILA|nr:unnamed protein product [Didymodactylos carnosus]CAF1218728.1 unnamed protein product [Didymodactylos carnosus]CAF3694745.1 unnamed protein product [Didymodactylos carnosus]CAF3982246.1 unnamed protein product [Didymodactylos carnosus]